MPNEVLAARSRLGVATRRKQPSEIESARQDLAAAKLEAYVEKIVSGAPPLTTEQRARLAALFTLTPGGETA